MLRCVVARNTQKTATGWCLRVRLVQRIAKSVLGPQLGLAMHGAREEFSRHTCVGIYDAEGRVHVNPTSMHRLGALAVLVCVIYGVANASSSSSVAPQLQRALDRLRRQDHAYLAELEELVGEDGLITFMHERAHQTFAREPWVTCCSIPNCERLAPALAGLHQGR